MIEPQKLPVWRGRPRPRPLTSNHSQGHKPVMDVDDPGQGIGRVSNCLQHNLLCRLRQLDWNEILFWIQVVFTGLVNDPHLMEPGRLIVVQEPVQFSQFQRRRIACVSHTNYETRFTLLRVRRKSA
jgi:hypothetical protein